jgi:hypothetical protein
MNKNHEKTMKNHEKPPFRIGKQTSLSNEVITSFPSAVSARLSLGSAFQESGVTFRKPSEHL